MLTVQGTNEFLTESDNSNANVTVDFEFLTNVSNTALEIRLEFRLESGFIALHWQWISFSKCHNSISLDFTKSAQIE